MGKGKKPGYRLLYEAARAVCNADSESREQRWNELLVQLAARTNEQLPDDQLPFVIRQVMIALSTTDDATWHSVGVEFVRQQVGIEVLDKFLMTRPGGRDWRIQLYEIVTEDDPENVKESFYMVLDPERLAKEGNDFHSGLLELVTELERQFSMRRSDPKPHLN